MKGRKLLAVVNEEKKSEPCLYCRYDGPGYVRQNGRKMRQTRRKRARARTS